jgi:hypothetical protein
LIVVGKTVKGLTEHQFHTPPAGLDLPKIDSSSHTTEWLMLSAGEGRDELYLKKTYASPSYTQRSGSQRGPSFFGRVISNLFSTSPTDNVDVEEKQLQLSGQLEAFYSALYRLIMCDRAAETYALFNDADQCIGTVSKKISGFKSARSQDIPISTHIEDFARMFVASFCLEEDDLHKGNYGVNDEGRICRLDFDMSGWPETADNKGQRAVSYGSILQASPKSAFALDEKDMRDLPQLHTAKPFYWPTSMFYYFSDAYNFKHLKDDLAFNREKYLSFLFFCLIPDDYIKKLGNFYIQDKYFSDRKSHVDNMIERKAELLSILIRMPAFYCTLFNEGQFKKPDFSAWEKIKSMFEEYNTHIKTTQNYNIDEVINIDLIHSNFEAICRRAEKFEPAVKTFKHHNFEPFEVPASHRAIYAARKEGARMDLRRRLEYLKQVKAAYESSGPLLHGNNAPSITDTAKSLYDHYVRRKDVKELKIKWLTEVLANSEDESKVIMEWFQTKETPFYPVIQTGETGKLIEKFKREEDSFARTIVESSQDNNIPTPTVSSDDGYGSLIITEDAEKEIADYQAKLKCFFIAKVTEQVTEYQKRKAFDWNSEYRPLKLAYWSRVNRDLPKANDFAALFNTFKFTQAEERIRDKLVHGDNTKKLIGLVGLIQETLPEVPTERNHAINWVCHLLKDNESVPPQRGYGSGMWGSSLSNYTVHLKETLRLLIGRDTDADHSVENCFNRLDSSNARVYNNDIAALMEIFKPVKPYMPSASAASASAAPAYASQTRAPFGGASASQGGFTLRRY